MTRKALSLLVATLLAISLFPGVAFASATSTAFIRTGSAVLPAAARSFTFGVTAQDAPVNYVAIQFPASSAGITANTLNLVTPPSGWKAGYKISGGVQQVVFTGGQILSGNSLNFTVPGDVARPLDRDRTGTWRLFTSSNGGVGLMEATVSPNDCLPGSCTLTTRVRILEVQTVTLLGPSGVLDKTGTEQQSGIQIQTTVKNHAQNAVPVTPSLTSSVGFLNANDEVIVNPAAQTVAGGATSAFTHAVTLGSAVTNTQTKGRGDKTVSFTGNATAPSGTAFTSGLSGFVVQRAASISLPSTDNVSPRSFRPLQSVAVSMPLSKANNPAVTVNSGTLSFSNTSCPLASPVSFGQGTNPGTLAFNCNVENLTNEEKTANANVTLSGVDDNGAPYTQSFTPITDSRTPSQTLSMTIDALLPKVQLELRLPLDGDGNQQTALKKGDTVRVVGELDDSDADLSVVELRSNTGEPAAKIEVTEVPDPENQGAGTKFVGQVVVPFDAAGGELHGFAQAVDPAGNVGTGTSTTGPDDNRVPQRVTLDNVKPLFNFSITQSTTDLESIAYDGEDFEPTTIRVQFAEANLVRGGCNPGQWKVDGAQVVVSVLNSNGSLCEKDSATPPADNTRVLLLAVPIDRNATPSVTYSPLAGDRAHDSAGNTADQRVMDTIAGIAPPIPDLIDVYRNTGTIQSGDACASTCEVAYHDADEDKYYTRFAGSDLLVHVSRSAPGYSLQVLDGTGTVVASKSLTMSTGSIKVPLGSTDGDYPRQLRFVNARGIAGKTLALNVVLDRTVPQLASTAIVTEAQTRDQVKLSFNEKVVEGLDAAANFPLFDEVAPGEYADPYMAQEVRQEMNPATLRPFTDYRMLTANTGRFGTFAGVGYVFDEFVSGNVRYGDRAGNKLADVGSPAAKAIAATPSL